MPKQTKKTGYESNTEKKFNDLFAGKKIIGARFLSDSEAIEQGWLNKPFAIILEDGTFIIPMKDDEGNDAGSLLTTNAELPVIANIRAN